MSDSNCRLFDSCSAPICPLDEQNSEYIWYPDEEICRQRKDVPNWVTQQRKIAKDKKKRAIRKKSAKKKPNKKKTDKKRDKTEKKGKKR